VEQDLIQGAIIGAIVGGVFALLGYVVAITSKGLNYLNAMPKRVMGFAAPQTPDVAYATLLNGVGGVNAPVTAADPANRRILFAKSPGLFDWGFFYPVHITALPQGGSQIQVGIASRAFQWGPLVTKAHKAFTDATVRALGMQPTP
jgi:hypothetical protein